jgi:hypothetical protein
MVSSLAEQGVRRTMGRRARRLEGRTMDSRMRQTLRAGRFARHLRLPGLPGADASNMEAGSAG